MDAELLGIILITLLGLFFIVIYIGLIFTILLILIILIRSLHKSERFRKLARKWNFEFYGVEDIRERLDDIAEIKKSNAEILEKLNRLVREKE